MTQSILAISIMLFLSSCGTTSIDTATKAIPVARQQQLKESIRMQDEKMQRAFMEGNLDEFVKYLHPEIIKAMGEEKIKEAIRASHSEVVKSIVKRSAGEVSEVVEDNGRLVAFVPYEMEFKFPKGRGIKNSYSIACSADNGVSWTFIESQGESDQEDHLRKMFPVLTTRFRFPSHIQKRL